MDGQEDKHINIMKFGHAGLQLRKLSFFGGRFMNFGSPAPMKPQTFAPPTVAPPAFAPPTFGQPAFTSPVFPTTTPTGGGMTQSNVGSSVTVRTVTSGGSSSAAAASTGQTVTSVRNAVSESVSGAIVNVAEGGSAAAQASSLATAIGENILP